MQFWRGGINRRQNKWENKSNISQRKNWFGGIIMVIVWGSYFGRRYYMFKLEGVFCHGRGKV